jgi:hypothetical protein
MCHLHSILEAKSWVTMEQDEGPAEGALSREFSVAVPDSSWGIAWARAPGVLGSFVHTHLSFSQKCELGSLTCDTVLPCPGVNVSSSKSNPWCDFASLLLRLSVLQLLWFFFGDSTGFGLRALGLLGRCLPLEPNFL